MLTNKVFERFLLPNAKLTENMAFVLYSFVKFNRPQSILEVGAGYSTLFIAQAIKDVQDEIWYDRIHKKAILKNKTKFYGKKYNPSYDVIDSDTHILSQIRNVFNQLGCFDNLNVKLHHTMYESFSHSKKYDLLWVDAGLHNKLVNYIDGMLSCLTSNGMLLIHSTCTNKEGRNFLQFLNSDSRFQDYEIVNMVEPHKVTQNSFTLIKKKVEYTVYTENS